MVSVRSVPSLPALFVAQVITCLFAICGTQGAFSPSETGQAHIVKETQRDAAALTGSCHRSTPSSSAWASIEALVASMRMEVQAWFNEGNQMMQQFEFRFQIQIFPVLQSFVTPVWM